MCPLPGCLSLDYRIPLSRACGWLLHKGKGECSFHFLYFPLIFSLPCSHLRLTSVSWKVALCSWALLICVAHSESLPKSPKASKNSDKRKKSPSSNAASPFLFTGMWKDSNMVLRDAHVPPTDFAFQLLTPMFTAQRVSAGNNYVWVSHVSTYDILGPGFSENIYGVLFLFPTRKPMHRHHVDSYFLPSLLLTH